MRQIKKSPEPAHFINWKHNFKVANGRDAIYDDLCRTSEYYNLKKSLLEEQRKAALDTVLDVEFEDEDLFADKDYVEAVVEDYDNMQEGEYVEFCSMITYCLQEYCMPK